MRWLASPCSTSSLGRAAVVQAAPPAGPSGGTPLRTLGMLVLLALIALVASQRGRRAHGIRAGPSWAAVPLLVLFASNISCGSFFGSTSKATWNTEETVYFHQGFSAGPTMMTDGAGNVFEERRYEPFGVDIDAYSGVAGGVGPNAAIDFGREPLNILNKESDEDTKWSYHGARWVPPQTARWHTPDPIVKAPDATLMAEPAKLHPYQYVEQNPVIFWDPDGVSSFYFARNMFAKGAEAVGDSGEKFVKKPYKAAVAVKDHAVDGAQATFNFAKDMKEQPAKGNFNVMLYRTGEFFTGVTDNPISSRIRENLELNHVIDTNSDAYRAGAFVGDATAAVGAGKAILKKSLRSVGLCGPCCKKCFEAGTLVATRAGRVPIEEIEAGDEVACADVDTGEWGWCEVVAPIAKTNDEGLVTISAGAERLVSSESHPYWVVDGDDLAFRPASDELDGAELVPGFDGGRRVMARDLRVGDMLLLASGASLAVERVLIELGEDARIRVFNLDVATEHNFAVGDSGVLVHNCSLGQKLRSGQIPLSERVMARSRARDAKGRLVQNPTLEQFNPRAYVTSAGQGIFGSPTSNTASTQSKLRACARCPMQSWLSCDLKTP